MIPFQTTRMRNHLALQMEMLLVQLLCYRYFPTEIEIDSNYQTLNNEHTFVIQG